MSILIKGLDMPKEGTFVHLWIRSDGRVTKTGETLVDDNAFAGYNYLPRDREYSAIEAESTTSQVNDDGTVK